MDDINDEVAHNGEPPHTEHPHVEPTEVKETHVPPPPPTDHDSSLKETVDGLVTAVSGLTTTVTQLVNKANPDSTPVRKPWTHWGSK